jgi:hypothetical protein
MPARTQRISPIVSTLAMLLLVVACSNTPTPAGSGAPTPSDVAGASAPPVASLSPSMTPSAPPTTPSVKPEPTPTPKPAVWSKATTVPGLDGCSGVVAVIDSTGGDHLAAECGNGDRTEIRYATSADGRSWTATRLALPAHRLEMNPQLAVYGRTLYLAYSRLAPTDGSCGDDGLVDVGVYVRSRELPGGAWSEPRQIGATSDELQSFRVSDGTVHATVTNDHDGKTYYESEGTRTTGPQRRIAIPGAAGATALRLSDDGSPRIAFEGASGLIYGTVEFGLVDGTYLTTAAIPATKRGWNPVFVLEPGDVADLVWTRSWHDGGCAEPGPLPEDGTYFSTNAGGSWHSTKLSGTSGGQSITVDPDTGEIHVLVSDFRSATLFERATNGTWSHRSLATGGVSSAVIRHDPSNGSLFVAYVSSRGAVGGDENVEVVKVMTKG